MLYFPIPFLFLFIIQILLFIVKNIIFKSYFVFFYSPILVFHLYTIVLFTIIFRNEFINLITILFPNWFYSNNFKKFLHSILNSIIINLLGFIIVIIFIPIYFNSIFTVPVYLVLTILVYPFPPFLFYLCIFIFS